MSGSLGITLMLAACSGNETTCSSRRPASASIVNQERRCLLTLTLIESQREGRMIVRIFMQRLFISAKMIHKVRREFY